MRRMGLGLPVEMTLGKDGEELGRDHLPLRNRYETHLGWISIIEELETGFDSTANLEITVG